MERPPFPPEITRGKEIDLSGKVAIVTGSSRGIGRAIGFKLAWHGASVVFNSRESSAESGLKAVEEIESFGGQALYVPGDVSEQEFGEVLIRRTVEKFGRVDILVLNAGTRADRLFIRMRFEELDLVMKTNVYSLWFIGQPAVIQMLRQKEPGSIVLVSSIASHGSPGQTNYSAAKAAVEGFSKALAVEYPDRDIRVNAVAPGYVETDLTAGLKPERKEFLTNQSPLKRAILAEEVAETVLFLASDRSSGINAQVINVDGGIVR